MADREPIWNPDKFVLGMDAIHWVRLIGLIAVVGIIAVMVTR